ncbi:MAG: aspartate aminotransferase family protein [Acidobacteria bacterium]|nr:aspartate aminotransferase family protein [Acidobacteriota bacterium]
MTKENELKFSDSLSDDPLRIRRMADNFIDVILNYWQSSGDDPVLPLKEPADFLELQGMPLPEEGHSLTDILDDFTRLLLPGITRIASPRYLGMMNPTPTLIAVFAESLAAALNQNCSLWHQSPAAVETEKTVIRWLWELVGLEGSQPAGTLVSGGSIANITALQMARRQALGPALRRTGLYDAPPLRVYVSDQSHYSFEKAMEFLGLGLDNLRLVPSDHRFRIQPTILDEMIHADRAAGFRPAAIIGIAGTTNTGAVDPLDDLADLARHHDCWFHVDAAYGGAALLVPAKQPLFRGIGRADSITLDPHKWFFIPYEAAALLVRDPSALQMTFQVQPAYYLEQGRDDPSKINPFEMGLQGSRSFKALKIWMAFRFFGRHHYRRILERHLGFALRLHAFLAGTGAFELLHPPDLGILCFRARPRCRGDSPPTAARFNELNRRLHQRLEREGRFWISITRMPGDRLALRVNFQNYRTREEDFEELCAYLLHLVKEEA